jgi:hypothetical protein
MPCRAAAWASAAKSGGPSGGGQGEAPGGPPDLGGELLEPGRGMQGEKPCGGGGPAGLRAADAHLRQGAQEPDGTGQDEQARGWQ